MHTFKAQQVKNGGIETYIDDKKVSLRACDVRMRPDEVTTVKVELSSIVDLECECVLELSDDEVFYMVKDRMTKDPEFRMRVLKKIKELQQMDDAKIVSDFRKAGWDI